MKTMKFRRSIFSTMLGILFIAGWMVVFGGISQAAVFVVTNTNNNGTGSLRLAMNNANTTAGKDTINFNLPGAGPHLFQPASLLPIQVEPIVIDATTQPDYAGTPVIVLDGIFAGSGNIDGIVLSGGDSMVKGLAIIRFSDRGIEIRSTENTIQGNYIGISRDGFTPFGNGTDGIAIFESNNIIGGTTPAARNIISANNGRGIFINTIAQSSGLVINNIIQGNYIGTASDGATSVGNRLDNILIFNAANNTIGGPGVGNIISASVQSNGIRIISNDGTTSGNIVQGNLIGIDVSGSLDRGNALSGILVQDAFDNMIGGTVEGAGNIISGNNRGIEIRNSMSTGNIVQGNFIGIDSTGTSALRNSGVGVLIIDASNNTIGGSEASARNIISGNGDHGIRISLLAPGVADNNIIQGNYIGTTVTGDAELGNGNAGIFLAGTSGTQILDNLISDNINGIVLNGTFFPAQPTENNQISGNFIGTDFNGSAAIPNRFDGISFLRASNNTIGGPNMEDRNLISGNKQNGIYISSEGDFSINNIIQGNYIGVNAAASGVLPNLQVGIFIVDGGASGTIIGGTENGAGNVIAGQLTNISLSSGNNQVQGNYIGTNVTGVSLGGNDRIGVWLLNSSNNKIGGFATGAANTIAHHSDSGIILFGNSSNNLIARNTLELNELNGVRIGDTGTGNAIRENSIHSNNFLGIDLDTDGVTPNDQNDADTGPNDFQNHPLLITATPINGVAISANLHSLANTAFIIEYFNNSECDPSGYGEGQSFIGAKTIVTDANGDAFFTAQFSNMPTGTEYITATATDTAGNTSEFSPCIQIETVIAPPDAPGLVAPADAATNVPLNETFAWTQSSGADRYHIQLSTAMNFSNIVYEDSSLAGTTQTTAQSLESSTTFYWRVRAHNILGWGNYSAVFIFAVGASPIAPSLTDPLDQAIDQATTVTFTWAPVQAATAYHLQLSMSANFASLVVNDSTLTASTHEVQSLAEGAQYYWRVKAQNNYGWGPYSVTRTFDVASLPAAPELIEPANAAVDLTTAVTFTWVEVEGATVYHLQLSTDANFASLVVNDSTVADSTLKVQSLAEEMQYYWRVRAKNTFGWGPYSTTLTFGVGSLPAAPELIEPANEAIDLTTAVTFTWVEVQGATSFHLQLSTDSNFTLSVVNDSTLADSTLEVQSLTEGTQYYWRVRAENSFGWGSYSATRTFKVIKATRVEESTNIPITFVLRQNYPNPFNPSTSISYELPRAENVRIIVYDLAGRQVRELVNEHQDRGFYTVLWDGRNERNLLVASGLYIYQIQAGEFNQRLKMTFLK